MLIGAERAAANHHRVSAGFQAVHQQAVYRAAQPRRAAAWLTQYQFAVQRRDSVGEDVGSIRRRGRELYRLIELLWRARPAGVV
jgi:hypothetical protein